MYFVQFMIWLPTRVCRNFSSTLLIYKAEQAEKEMANARQIEQLPKLE